MPNRFYDKVIWRLGTETATSFEKRAGLGAGTLTNLRKGGTPSRVTLYKIAEAFGEPIEKWVEIAKATRDPSIRPGRSRRNGSYLDALSITHD